MRRKGTVVMIVAIIILLIAEALILSFAFNRVSIQVRELNDATIVYEGDEMEAFARSIDSSIDQAVAQGLQEYYRAHEKEQWGDYDVSSVPSDDSVAGEVKNKASPYVDKFLTAFKEEAGKRKFSLQPGSGIAELNIQPNSLNEPGSIIVSLPQVSMAKTLDDFATASYERKFTPATGMRSALGDMLKFARERLTGSSNVLNGETVKAIGYPGKVTNPPADKYSYPKRGGPTGYQKVETREMRAYIDQDSTCIDPQGEEPGNKACFKTGQTATKGALEYCLMDETKVTVKCGPCEGVDPEFSSDPGAEQVYPYSHGGMSYGSASAAIKNYAWERALANEYKLDGETQTFTVAFDGNNFEDPSTFDAIENSIKLDAQVSGGCQEPKVIGLCNPVPVGTCDPPADPIKYKCYQKKRVVCDYSHFAKADVTVRLQEDGFTYGVSDEGKQVADTPKLVFRTVAGNGKGAIG